MNIYMNIYMIIIEHHSIIVFTEIK